MKHTAFRVVNLMTVLALALGFAWATPTPALAANPAPVQIFYVTLPESEGLRVLSAINGAAVSPMYTYFSIAIGMSGAYVYYDQWENGYDSDIANPTNIYSAGNPGGTQIWGNGKAIDGCAPNITGAPVTCTDANDVLNAGNVIIPYNAVPLIPGGASYVLDNFNTTSYSNNNGTVNWSGNWVETGDDGSASTGKILIPGGAGGNHLRFTAAQVNDSIDRGLDLTAGDDCTELSFTLGRSGADAGENFAVQFSSDGSTYFTLDTFTSASATGLKSYALSPSYFTAAARLRFISTGDGLETNEYYSVDDARVQWGCASRDSSVILFDGKDKVGASKSVSMARATWASGSGTLNAFAHEMYATAEWGTVYESPVGTDTANAGEMFEYSALAVMAVQNNTTVQVDANADGIYGTFILQEGGSYLISGILQGARVQSDKPVQVVVVTGDIDSNYASRDMNLLPANAWGSSYWSPVGVNTDDWPGTAGPTRLYLYNPSTNGNIYITCERRTTVPTTSTQGPILPRGVVTLDLADDEGAHCYASNSSGTATTDKILAIGTIDTENTAGDWSFTLYPDNFLSTNALIGLGLGKDPTDTTSTENSSPLWVTSACASGGTYVYVDWTNDGTADLVDLNGDGDTVDTVDGISESTSSSGMLVNRLHSVRLFKPSPRNDPYDQSGARVWSRTASGVGQGGTPGCNLALAWGQDPRRSTAGEPGLDVGTSVPPLRLIEGTKSLELKTDTNGDGQLNPGDIATYNITVKNSGSVLVTNVYVYDTIPPNTTYVPGSTEKDVGSGWTPITDDPDFPLNTLPGVLLGDLAAGATFYVRFDVTLGGGSYGELLNCDVAQTDAGTLSPCRTDFVATRDWGDLPDSYGTSLAANGPSHSYSGLKLGVLWDYNAQGIPTASANGDDLAPALLATPDDEDGIDFNSPLAAWGAAVTPKGAAKVTVAGGPGCLNAWMDFSNGSAVGGDGDFGDTYLTISEKVVNNVLLNNGTTDVAFNVPAGLLGATTRSYYLRFRLSPPDANGACTTVIAPTGFVAGGEVEDYLLSLSPLAVDLAFFTADATEAGVTLAWETVSELDNAGFNIYRADAADGSWAQLNAALIPAAAPGSSAGNAYTWTDAGVTPGAGYWYALEDVALNGSVTRHAPVAVTISQPTAVRLVGLGAGPALGLAVPLAAIGAALASGYALARRRRR